MPCNGRNHSDGCECAFGGRKMTDTAPRWHGWSVKQAKRLMNRPNANCPRCGAPCYYICTQSGGGAYFEKLGAPWIKHPCKDPTINKRFDDFTPTHEGWPLMVVTELRYFPSGTFLRGLCLNDNSVLCFASRADLQIDRTRPMSFRQTLGGHVEVSYFEADTIEPIYQTLIDDCASPFELLSREAA